MRRILFTETDFTALPTPPAGFRYIGFDGPNFSQKDDAGTVDNPGGGGSGGGLVQSTYAALKTLVLSNSLVPGTYYEITDFKTCYDQPDFDIYGGAIVGDNYRIGPTSSIIVYAISDSDFAADAWQPEFPQDRIKYDFSFDATEVTGGTAYGRISERIDEYNNRTDYDHRNIYFKRYDSYSSDELQSGTVSISGGVVTGYGTSFENFMAGDVIAIPYFEETFYKIASIDSDTMMTITGSVWDISAADPVEYYSVKTISKSSYKKSNAYPDDYLDYLTFAGGSINNYIGDNSNLYGDGSDFMLANNVFFSGSNKNNRFGNGCANNTIVGDCEKNSVGCYFKNNRIASEFKDNEIGNGFESNRINIETGIYWDGNSYGFNENRISNDFFNNTVYCQFRKNSIGTQFKDNTVGSAQLYSSSFIHNAIGERVKGSLFASWTEDNLIANNFYSNQFYGSVYSNRLGSWFFFNDFYGSFENNVIESGFYSNQIADQFCHNKIGDDFNNNHISTFFQYNELGSDFQSNNVAENFAYNKIGTGFYENNIGHDFGYGGGQAQGNKIGSFFEYNEIGEYFYSNTVADLFHNNTVGDWFQSNDIKVHELAGVDFRINYNQIMTYSTNIGLSPSIPGTIDYSFTGVTASGASASGYGAEFTVVVSSNQVSELILTNAGYQYENGDVLTIPYSSFSGIEGNDIVISMVAVSDKPAVYAQQNCTIFKNAANINRISYYDENDVLTITSISGE